MVLVMRCEDWRVAEIDPPGSAGRAGGGASGDDAGGRTFATDPRIVAQQAGMVATAWSPPGAPPSWRLTAAQFEALRNDEEMLAIAATIPPDRLRRCCSRQRRASSC
jgi:hypothetical protein